MRRVKFLVNDDNQLDLVFYGFVDVSFRLLLPIARVHVLLTICWRYQNDFMLLGNSKILRVVNISSEVAGKNRLFMQIKVCSLVSV